MTWKKNRKLVDEGYPDLAYLPRASADWDASLAALAYGLRRALGRGQADLAAWAARHALPPSGRYLDFCPGAIVLWHGTSRPRAEKIAAHGLFHKKGLWSARDPRIAHGYCRGRSERFATQGAMVCIVLDWPQLHEGVDYALENDGEIVRFHGGLPPHVVEYVLTHDSLAFTGPRRAPRPRPWPRASFKKKGGRWLPLQTPPVRYPGADGQTYATLDEFLALTLRRLLDDLGAVTALEVFSTFYACVRPWDALTHDDVLHLLETSCVPARRHPHAPTFRPREGST